MLGRAGSPQCKFVILAAIINLFHTIWLCRNQKRFNDKSVNIRCATYLILSATSMSGNLTPLTASASMFDFVILKHFDVTIKPPKPQIIKEVIWIPPILNWTKCNTDGVAQGNPGHAACGSFYGNTNLVFLGGFAINLGITSALCSEIIGAMVAIKIAYHKGWFSMWLETDSIVVFLAFKSSKIVPWHLLNRWNNCLHLLSSMHFHVSRSTGRELSVETLLLILD